ncbi:hypothetical protein BA6E_12448 [Bacteroidales bacterium 6E]|nr:hypothetical protein BA6E_12448 [Bacteroidales bacterium 6E]
MKFFLRLCQYLGSQDSKNLVKIRILWILSSPGVENNSVDVLKVADQKDFVEIVALNNGRKNIRLQLNLCIQDPATVATGIEKLNSDPFPCRLVTQISPLFCLMSSRQRTRPRPELGSPSVPGVRYF